MRGLFLSSLTFLALLLSSCSTETPQPTPEVVSVFSTSAATPWLSEMYACADGIAVISRADDPSAADISLRVGEPEFLAGFAFQIDEENVIVIMNNARPPVVSLEQIRGMFTGVITNLNQITPAWGEVHSDLSGEVHVWVYPPDDDVQQAFEQLVLEGRPITPSASLAITPQDMFTAVRNDRSAVGILLQQWNPNYEVFEQAVVGVVPVLAITQSEPQGAVNQLIGCLQK